MGFSLALDFLLWPSFTSIETCILRPFLQVLLRLPDLLRRLSVSGATCMSTSSDPLQALLLAVQHLQLSVDSLSARLGAIEEKLGLEAEHWEVVEASFDPPARVPLASNTTCPDIPAALLSFAEKLSSVDPGHVVRAKRAFEAGFRARVSLDSGCWYVGAKTSLPIKDTVWVVLQAPGLKAPARVSLKTDLNRLTHTRGPVDVIAQGFPSLTEVQIFCAGCDIPVPPLCKWKSR